MPIKRLKKSSEEELITHIKNSLADHEEEYAPGAWENFNKVEIERPSVLLWITRISAAAALLLIGFGTFFYLRNDNITNKFNNTVVKNSPAISAPKSSVRTNRQNEGAAQLESNSAGKSDEVKITGNSAIAQSIAAINEQLPMTNLNSDLVISSNSTAFQEQTIQQPNTAISTVADQPLAQIKKPITIDEFLDRENKLESANSHKKDKQVISNKWDLGVVVAPSFGNTDQLNMGYGISMAYNLNDKISLSSGLSYNEMGASKKIAGNSAPNSPSANGLVNDTKALKSVNTRVSGIDIPLELRYNLSNRFYANVGVSAFAVINQQQNNVYLQGTVVQRSATNLAGDVQTQSFLITEQVSEKAPETISPNSKMIGFYNFSFGYKQKLSKDKSIGIEPFMKVPMSNVTKENLRLLGTGLKVKFDF
jgi:hypothetical protein